MMNAVTSRLLIVDDEEPLMRALCDTLGQLGYATTGCASAAEALQTLQGGQFDLMLTDMMMPDTDGLALARAARAHDPNMVAVMMTGQGSIERAVEAMQAGVVDYVLKPFKLSTMLPVLERALEIRRLQSENAALQAQLRMHVQELEVANRELEAYAATVSHDLRAPLRGIGGMAALLAAQLAQVMTPDARRLLDLIASRALRAQTLIDDLLRLSRVGRVALSCTEVDVAAMARDVAAEASTGLECAAPDVVVAPDLPTACADRQLLRQIFVNLIGNAFKFTRHTPSARIDVGGYVANGCRIYSVKDNGPGFDMQHSGKLFLPFERLRGAEKFEGSGVGLSIVQRIVQRHGGHVWVQATAGGGACFYFTLDAGPAGADAQ